DGIRALIVTGVQTCALPIYGDRRRHPDRAGLPGIEEEGEVVRQREPAVLGLEREDDAVRERVDEHHEEVDRGRQHERRHAHGLSSAGSTTTRSGGSRKPTAAPTPTGCATRAITVVPESTTTSTSCSRPRYSVRRTVPRT